MSQWEEKRLAALVDAAEHAIRRARYVFIAINVATIFMLVAQFNALLPWLRHSAFRLAVIEESKSKTLLDSQMEQARDIRREMLERDLATMSVPLVGVKIHSSDLSVLGSLAMAVLAVWYYYSVRRENHVVGEILLSANKALAAPTTPERVDKARYLDHAIAHYFVFTTATTEKVGAKMAVKVLMYAPAWIPLVLATCDLLSMLVPLAWLRIVPSNEIAWCRLHTFEAIELVLRECLAGSIAAFNFIRCRDVMRLDSATREELINLNSRVDAESRRIVESTGGKDE